MWKQLLRPTNRRIRLLVGVFLAGLFCIQCTRTEAFRESRYITVINGTAIGQTAPDVLSEIEHLAKTDHIALLKRCLENYKSSYRDFTCTFVKQEVVRGQLKPEQEIRVKHITSPFSVAMEWIKNPPLADRVLYVEGERNNQMLVRPHSPLLQLLTGGSVERAPDGPQAMQNTLRPVSMFGFGRGLESLIKVYSKAQTEGDLKTTFGGYAFVGGDPQAGIEGRKCVVLIRHLPPKNDYPAYKTLVYIDVDYLVPICIEGYDWDEKLQCRYIYKDLKFNVALREDDFTPQAIGIVVSR